MAKLAQNFAKYVVQARMNAKGVVERPDIIGAIFGQTEGLLGQELDLRELQRTGRIGRIEVDVKTAKGKSYAEILIPSSLDSSETALIAASLETIDKVGPCDAEMEITKVEDVRSQKRRYVVERAKEVLKAMMEENGMPDSQKLSEMIKESVRALEVSNYHGVSCGPDILESDEVVVVEGRADVINMLRHGIRNCIAIEGSRIPEPVINLTKEKITTAFLDGDRGGDLDLKKLLAVADIDYVARAEQDKEVEELTKKQIFKSLRERVPIDQLTEKRAEPPEPEAPREREELDPEKKKFMGSLLEDLLGTRAAYLVDKNLQILSKVPMSELGEMLGDYQNVYAIIFDGKVNQAVVDTAMQRKVAYLVGTDYKENVSHGPVRVLVLKDLVS